MARRKKKLSFVQALMLSLLAPSTPRRHQQYRRYWRSEKEVLSAVRNALNNPST